MPQFFENPSLLTKERLKSDLKAHGVQLPRGDNRKDAYVQLYLEHLTSRNKSPSPGSGDFSSDEEDATNTPAKPTPRVQPKPIIRKPVKGLPYDVQSLSDGDLARQLKSYGQVVGPITDTTRPLYQKKLLKILQEESKNPVSVPKVDTKPRPWEYSDTEEDPEIEDEIVENGEHSEDDDEIDAIPEAPAPRPARQIKKRVQPPPEEPKYEPKEEPTPVPTKPPNVIKRETVIQETYMETRKRTREDENKVRETTPVRKEVTPTVTITAKPKQVESFLWKAILVLLALTTVALLVFYHMEGNPDKPSITNSSQ